MAHNEPHMAHKEPHVDHSPEPRVALCEPCVALCEPGVASGTDEPRVARSELYVAQVFLQCRLKFGCICIVLDRKSANLPSPCPCPSYESYFSSILVLH